MRRVALLALALPLTTAFGQSGSVWGVVRDRSGHGVPGVEVAIPVVNAATQTDSLGKYQLRDVASGTHVVVARRLGLIPDTVRLFVKPGEDYEHDFLLDEAPKSLDTVAVKARAVQHGNLAAFDERRRIGIGSFWTQQQLDRFPARRTSDFLIQAPSVRIRRGRGTSSYVFGGRGMQCPSRVYLDGAIVYNGNRGEPLFDVDMLAPSALGGMEYYPGGAAVPSQYNATNSACGVLLIWTRER